MANEKNNGSRPEVSIEQRLADAANIIEKANATAKVKKTEQQKQQKNSEAENKKRLEEQARKRAEDEANAKKLAEKKIAVLEYTEEYRRKLKERERAAKKPAQPTKKQQALEEERQSREREAKEALRREEEDAARRKAEIDALLNRAQKERRESKKAEEPTPTPAPAPTPAPTPAPAPAPTPTPTPAHAVEESAPERIVINIDDEEDDSVLRIDGQNIGAPAHGYSAEAVQSLEYIRRERARIRSAMLSDELLYKRELSALDARHRAASYAAMERARFERLDYTMLLASEEARYRNELAMLSARHAQLAGAYMERRRMLENSERRFSLDNPNFGLDLENERFAYNRELEALMARRNAMAASYAQKRFDLSSPHSFLAEDNALLAKEEALYKKEIDELIARREALARQYEERKRAIEAETVSFSQSGADFDRIIADEERLYNERLADFKRRHDEIERRFTEKVNAIAATSARSESIPDNASAVEIAPTAWDAGTAEEPIFDYESFPDTQTAASSGERTLRDPLRPDAPPSVYAQAPAEEQAPDTSPDDRAIQEFEKHQSAALAAKGIKKKRISYEENMPVVSEAFVKVAEGDSIFSGTVITKGKLPEYLHKIKLADKAYEKEAKKLASKSAALAGADLAVNLLDIIAIRRKALIMHIEGLLAVVSIDKKRTQRKYAYQLSLAISKYNSAVSEYMASGDTRLASVSTDLPNEIMNSTVVPTVPYVTYTFGAPVLSEAAPSKAQLKEQRREARRLDKIVTQDMKRLHALVDKATDRRLTAISASFEPAKLFANAEEQMKNDLRALIYRFDYLEMSYTNELALCRYRHALSSKDAKRGIREIKKNLKFVKKMQKKAIKLERLDNLRYYTALCTSPETCRAKKRADRDALAAMHARLSDMLAKRDAENLELIALYSQDRGISNRKFNKRLDEAELIAAAKAFRRTKSDAKKIRKAKTYDPKIAIDKLNSLIAVTAELAKEELRQKKLKIKSVSFKTKLRNMREEKKQLEADVRSYVKRAKSGGWIKTTLIVLLVLAIIGGAAFAVYYFRNDILALLPESVRSTIEGWLS